MRSLAKGLTARTSPARVRRDRALLLGLLLAGLLQASVGQTAPPKPSQVRTHLQRAEAALKENNPEAAAREFRTVLALDPRNVEAHVDLGMIQMYQGNCQDASHNFRQALAAQSSLTKAKALLGICGRRLGDRSAKGLLQGSFTKLTDTKLRTQVGMELIGLYHQEGNSEHAVAVVQKLVELNPDDADILYVAQRLYRELADDTLNKLAVLAPGSARMQQVIAQRLINAGDLKGAIEHYRKALEISPRLPGVHYELAQAIVESAQSDSAAQDEAQKELEAAIAAEGDSARVQCELGKIALLRSNSEQAQAHYARAFALAPNDTEAQLGLGRTLMTMERVPEARKYLEMAVKSDPLNGAAHYRLALAYKRLQMPDAAQSEMHLFQEIKVATDRVKQLYRQMNTQYQPATDEISGNEQ